jgi:hypothetical protein
VTFDTFVAQVVAYLPPEQQQIYSSEAAFDAMLSSCLELLESGAP